MWNPHSDMKEWDFIFSRSIASGGDQSAPCLRLTPMRLERICSVLHDEDSSGYGENSYRLVCLVFIGIRKTKPALLKSCSTKSQFIPRTSTT